MEFVVKSSAAATGFRGIVFAHLDDVAPGMLSRFVDQTHAKSIVREGVHLASRIPADDAILLPRHLVVELRDQHVAIVRAQPEGELFVQFVNLVSDPLVEPHGEHA